MTPVKQTILSGPDTIGNCLQACVASLLDMSLDDVPHFCASDGWPMNFYRWLETRGLVAVRLKSENMCGPECWLGYHIIIGPSPRSGKHGVIGLNGEIVFDPHPSDAGLMCNDWEFVFIFDRRN